MTAFAVRAVLSGIIIALIAVIGRKAPAAGALIASLPLISNDRDNLGVADL